MAAVIVPAISSILGSVCKTNGSVSVLATSKIYPGMVGFISDGSSKAAQVQVISVNGYDLRLRTIPTPVSTGALQSTNLSADDFSAYVAGSTLNFPSQLVDLNVKTSTDAVNPVISKAFASVDMAQATQTSKIVSTQNNTNVGIQINLDTTAFGTITISGGSGAITATINSTPVSGITWATSDTATAAALVTAINGNGILAATVVASSVAGVVTILSKALGAGGNAYTLAASGTGVSVSGATFTAGTLPTGTFDIQGSLDYLAQIQGLVTTANWASITVDPVPAAAGAAAHFSINMGQTVYPFIRLVYTRVSGNGLLDCLVSVRTSN
jgi:hypothetical protein